MSVVTGHLGLLVRRPPARSNPYVPPQERKACWTSRTQTEAVGSPCQTARSKGNEEAQRGARRDRGPSPAASTDGRRDPADCLNTSEVS